MNFRLMVSHDDVKSVWTVLGRSRGLCGRSWSAPQASVGGPWGIPKASVGAPGPLLEPLWALLGLLGADLGRKVALARIWQADLAENFENF